MDNSVNVQLNILTFVVGIGTVLVGAFMAYMKVSISNSIKESRLQTKAEIDSAKNELKADLARKDLTETKLQELERRITKTETWREAVMAASVTGSAMPPPFKDGV